MKIFFAFTLIELSLVMAIASLLLISGSIPVATMLKKMSVDSTTDNLLLAIQKSRQNSINSKNSLSWGVCIVSGKIYTFASACDASGRSESFTIQSLATVTGLNTTTFSKLYAEPSPANGLASVVISSGTYSKTISVNASGGVSVVVN